MNRRQWHPTPVLLPGESHGRRSLVGCRPWGRKELDMTEWLHFQFSLSCIGEGNGTPLQCSCLENPRDGGAGGLPSMGSHRVGHDWSDLAVAAAELWKDNFLLSFSVFRYGSLWKGMYQLLWKVNQKSKSGCVSWRLFCTVVSQRKSFCFLILHYLFKTDNARL